MEQFNPLKIKVPSSRSFVWVLGKEFEQASDLEMIKLLSKGLDTAVLPQFLRQTNLATAEIASILCYSMRQMQRKMNGDGRIDPLRSGILLGICELYDLGIKVYDVPLLFKNWLSAPLGNLDDLRPLDLLNSPYGILKVRDILCQIEYGIYRE